MNTLPPWLDALPQPDVRTLAVRVDGATEKLLRNGYPWVYASSVTRQAREGQPGDLAVIYDRRDRLLALGLWDPDAAIRVHVLAHGAATPLAADALVERLRACDNARAEIRASDSTGYRVLHGPSEDLPELILDRYADTLVLKVYAIAWLARLPVLLSAIQAALAPARIVLRTSRAVAATWERWRHAGAALPAQPDGRIVLGPPLDGPVLFRENGLWFESEPIVGQKTGFFLDQRENRVRIGALAAGARVLNAFSYTGGFSLYAARGGASSVTSLDISRPAGEAAVRNFAHNADCASVAACAHEVVTADAFAWMAAQVDAGRRFDVVIVDPPAFAKKVSEVPQALAAYAKLAGLAARLTAPSGKLVLASCSSRVDPSAFRARVQAAVAATGVKWEVTETTGHPTDHPARIPELQYLKAVFGRIHTP